MLDCDPTVRNVVNPFPCSRERAWHELVERACNQDSCFLGPDCLSQTGYDFWCFGWLVATYGLFKLSVLPLPFKRSKNRLERSSATPISDPPKFRLFTSLRTTEPPTFSAHFPLFGRFRAERSRTCPPNPDVSVSNAPFSPRNSFSSLIFGRKHILDPTFRQFSTFIFWRHACAF